MTNELNEPIKAFKEILAQTQMLVSNAKQEVFVSEGKADDMLFILEDILNWVQTLINDLHKFEFFYTNEQGDNQLHTKKVLENMEEHTEQLKLLSMSGQIEAVRLYDYGKGFFVVFQELDKISELLKNIISDFKIYALKEENKESRSDELLCQISRISKRINLLALNNSIEASKNNRDGTTFQFISEEIRSASFSIQNLLTEIELNLSKNE